MEARTLVAPSAHWSIWALLLASAAAGLLAERTRWGARLSGAVVSIGCGFILSNLGVLPASAPAYDLTWSYLVPLAIPLLLFRANLVEIFRRSGPTMLSFSIGVIGTVLGSLGAFWLVDVGPEGHKLAGIFCATYVGGSMNYMAVAKTLRLQSADLLAAGVAADNLVMTGYFLVLFALPELRLVKRVFKTRRPGLERAGGGPSGPAGTATATTLAASLALAAVMCAAGVLAEGMLGAPGSSILVVTLLAVVAATALPRVTAGLAGAPDLGVVLMQVFFAVIGATAHVGTVLKVGPVLFVFAAVILLVHLAVILVAGRLLRLDIREVVIASNANMGGPTTAAAMAAARRWHGLVVPAILCGTFGYAIASFIGTFLGHVLG